MCILLKYYCPFCSNLLDETHLRAPGYDEDDFDCVLGRTGRRMGRFILMRYISDGE